MFVERTSDNKVPGIGLHAEYTPNYIGSLSPLGIPICNYEYSWGKMADFLKPFSE